MTLPDPVIRPLPGQPPGVSLRRSVLPVAASLLLLVGLPCAGQAQVQARTLPPDTIAERVIACTACHGNQGRAGSDGFYPRIAGKPAGYLANQLQNFRDGRRQYPLMIYMVDHLSDAYLKEMAEYFAAQHPPYAPPQPVTASAAVLARGRQLVESGDKQREVPACSACHGANLTGVVPAIPGLVGLPRDYLSAQFGAWKNGARRAAAPDCMAQIAQRLSVDDISAAAAFLASLPVPSPATPARAPAGPLPITCGSVP
ncbi:MAG: c-type cytochrome [Herminiimonas sp.]|nr:c-type cytochrome [Herminiimonas sp.]